MKELFLLGKKSYLLSSLVLQEVFWWFLLPLVVTGTESVGECSESHLALVNCLNTHTALLCLGILTYWSWILFLTSSLKIQFPNGEKNDREYHSRMQHR